MKKIIVLLAVILSVEISFSQPQNMNYQAVIRDGNGNVLQNQAVSLRLDIIQGNPNGTVIYSETHDVTTNQYGMVSVFIGSGTVLQGAFADIDWGNGPYFLKTSVDIGNGMEELGTQELVSVPYSLFSKRSFYADSISAAGNTGDIQFNNNGSIDASPSLYWDITKERLGIGTNTPQGRVVIQQDPNTPDSLPLFEVKDKEGNPVFVVYPDSVHVFLRMDTNKTAGIVGGFAVSGRYTTKNITKPYFCVTPDSTRIYFDRSNAKTAGIVGGFAVSGRYTTKSVSNPYLYVTSDSTRIYFDENNAKTAGIVGGFAVSGRYTTKAGEKDYFNISRSDTTIINPSEPRVYWNPNKEALLTGRVLIESPDSVGLNTFTTGFESKAIGDYSQAMGYNSIARGNYSFAMGKSALVTGDSSYAFGNRATASGEGAFAIGSNAIASGNCSFALGSSCTTVISNPPTRAIGDYSYAFGFSAQAIGLNSFAIGYLTKANGVSSVALGNNTRADSYSSIVIGRNLISKSYAEFTIGSYNDTTASTSQSSWVETDPIFIIGNGTSNTSRHNAITVLKNGNVGINTNTPDKLLTVNGDARVTGDIYYGSIGTTTTYNKPDFVFKPDYDKNFSIGYIEKYIKRHGHLPWVTAAKDEENGINMTRMSFETLEAVENLQLQVIDLNKKLSEKDKELYDLKKENKEMKKRIDRIEKLLKSRK